MATLAAMRMEQTQGLILQAALHMLGTGTVSELTVGDIAKQAGLSERTVFRYFPTRTALLDAIAKQFGRELGMPPAPRTLGELVAMPRALYRSFEAKASLTRSVLHSELFPRMRDAKAKERWAAVRRIIDDIAPNAPERKRKVVAANVRYVLSATSWHYYRFYFGFNLEETIDAAETAIRHAIEGIRRESH